jgi:hypothetical protein
MLSFVIPVKCRAASKDWHVTSRLFERTLRSVCNQTTDDFDVLVVCNERPTTTFHHPNLRYLEVDFPAPEPEYGPRVDDRAKRVVAGLLALDRPAVTHVMSVDADDYVSRRLAAFVAEHPDDNGWYVDDGYELQEGSRLIRHRTTGFYQRCGTCNIIRRDLFTLPDTLQDYHRMTGFDRFIGGHPHARGDLEARGHPLQPLPFAGAVYLRDRSGESVTMQEAFRAKLARNPRELLRVARNAVMAPLELRPLGRELRLEFGLELDATTGP